jgi:hypothetical protein
LRRTPSSRLSEIKSRTGVSGRIKIHIFFQTLNVILSFKIIKLATETQFHIFARFLFVQISLILFSKGKVSTSINIYSTLLHVC